MKSSLDRHKTEDGGTKMKIGTYTADGLTSDFVYIRPHANTHGLHLIRTAAGEVWAWDNQLIFA